MKRKILSFIMSVVLVIPFAMVLTACGHSHTPMAAWESDDTHHWHKCTEATCTVQLDKAEHNHKLSRVEPTIDAAGTESYVCDCGHVQSTNTLPKIEQSKDEMIAVLNAVSNKETYNYVKYEETSNMMELMFPGMGSSTTTEILARDDNEMVIYTLGDPDDEPATWADEHYILEAEYLVNGDTNYFYTLEQNDEETSLEVSTTGMSLPYIVGDNYLNNYFVDELKENFGFSAECNTEAEIKEYLQDQLPENLVVFVLMGSMGTVDPEDVEVTVSTSYANQEYAIDITVSTDDVVYDDSEFVSLFKITNYSATYHGVYTRDCIKYLEAEADFDVVFTQGTIDTSDDVEGDIYIDSMFTMEIGRDVSSDIAMIRPYTAGYSLHGGYNTFCEYVTVDLAGERYGFDWFEAGASYNEYIDNIIAEIETEVDTTEVKVVAYLDEARTIEYDSTKTYVVEDYYGAAVYIEFEPVDDTKSILMVAYVTYDTVEDTAMLDYEEVIAVDSGEHTVDNVYDSVSYPIIYVDSELLLDPTVTLVAGETYKVVCEREVEG